MRFFRIPAFTGIETHRDDADRGSLRVVEGCLPHGPGGLRSGPVWKDAGSVNLLSEDEENHLTASDDGNGNSMLFVSRLEEVHDMAIISTENTEVSIFSSSYSVVNPVDLYEQGRAILTPVGNRLFSFGDGDGEAVFVGKGPPAIQDTKVFPDARLYSFEWSRFPNCEFFVQGPKKTLFAAGNPKRPLTVYISEPAGKTKPYRDTPYSTEEPAGDAFIGQLSTVDILMSNASKITALSSRGDQVVVHTDKGCHILYAPSADQASTGYRVEQVAATNFSAAVNTQVVGGEAGSMSFWLGHDGQIYKDESASRGAEDAKSFTDPDQASWKSKGLWEKELPTDLSQSFAAYDRESGMYWLFVRSDEYNRSVENDPSGRVINIEALPDLPGEIDVLTATPELPGQPVLTALPDTTGAVENATALPDAPGAVSNLSILAIPGEVTGLTAAQNLAGQVSNLTAVPDGSDVVENLTASPDIPGEVTALNAVPAIDLPGEVSSLSATPDAVGSEDLTLTAEPEVPSFVNILTATPDAPGAVSGLTAGVDMSCSNVQAHYWSYNGAFEDANGGVFDDTNTLFLTGIPVFSSTLLGRFSGPSSTFPDTQAEAVAAGTGEFFWNASSYFGTIPHNSGVTRDLGWNGEYQYWPVLRFNGTNSTTGAMEFHIPAVENVNGWRSVEYRIIQTASGAYEIGKWFGVNQLERWYKADNGVCSITGKYNNYNSSNWYLYIGLTPYSMVTNSNRGGAYHADGTSFKLDYTF